MTLSAIWPRPDIGRAQASYAHIAYSTMVALVFAAASTALGPSPARATVISFGANMEFSGGQAPGSATTPWVVVSFDDHGGTGSVDLTLTAPHLTASENVVELDLNIVPGLSGDLPLAFSGLVKTGSFDTPTIAQGEDAFKADGDGFYDIRLSFTVGGNTSKTFTNGDSLKYTLSGAGLTAASFDTLSTPAGGHGPFLFAAHSQNTTGAGSGGSGWITGPKINAIPEPSTVTLAVLGGIGLLGVTLMRRRS
jgi:hypothetical protein